MFTLTHLDTPPPESLKSQVLQMVVDYLSDISPVSLPPSNPLYQLYQYVVGFEVHRYLDSMDGAQAGKAPYFETLGFLPLTARGPQVVMNTRHQASDGLVAVQDLQPIFQSQEVRQIHSYLVKQHGAQAMSDAEKERDQLLDELAKQALHLAETHAVARHMH